MKIVLVGGSGRIGRPLDALLCAAGHETVVASPSRGVNAQTGQGLAAAFEGAHVVVDVSDSPSFEERAVMDFFAGSTANLLEAGRRAGIRHYVALSIVGTERAQQSAYYRAKLAQESLIERSGLPYTIVRATQFFDFLKPIADSFTVDGQVRVPDGALQPIAIEDVVLALAAAADDDPLNAKIEVAGPQTFPIDQLMRQVLAAMGDQRDVIVDPSARYFGTPLDAGTLVAGVDARVGDVSLADWLRTTASLKR